MFPVVSECGRTDGDLQALGHFRVAAAGLQDEVLPLPRDTVAKRAPCAHRDVVVADLFPHLTRGEVDDPPAGESQQGRVLVPGLVTEPFRSQRQGTGDMGDPYPRGAALGGYHRFDQPGHVAARLPGFLPSAARAPGHPLAAGDTETAVRAVRLDELSRETEMMRVRIFRPLPLASLGGAGKRGSDFAIGQPGLSRRLVEFLVVQTPVLGCRKRFTVQRVVARALRGLSNRLQTTESRNAAR